MCLCIGSPKHRLSSEYRQLLRSTRWMRVTKLFHHRLLHAPSSDATFPHTINLEMEIQSANLPSHPDDYADDQRCVPCEHKSNINSTDLPCNTRDENHQMLTSIERTTPTDCLPSAGAISCNGMSLKRIFTDL